MTPRERLLAALKGEPVDRVPLVLEGWHEPPDEERDDPGMQEIRARIKPQVHFFKGYPSGENRRLVTPPQRMTNTVEEGSNGDRVTTTTIDTPRGPLTAVSGRNTVSHTTWVVKYPVESLEDIEKIRSVPWEPPEGLTAPDLSTLPPGFEERGVTLTRISSPFVCVAGMMSYEYFLELCITEFELVRSLTELCFERICNLLDIVLAERSIELVWMGGCEWLTPPMASPDLYERLVQTYERPLIERIHAAGGLSHVHCHGNVRSTLERVIARGADFFEPVEPPPDGDVTFAEAKRMAAGRITLGGNVEARILEKEGPDAVEQASRAAFEGGKERMVFQSSAGPISAMTPQMVANYHRMIDVWEELSPMG